jgi:hypothetical protein
VTVFGAFVRVASVITRATCNPQIQAAIWATDVPAGAATLGTCITSAVIATAALAASSGLDNYGTSKGWQFEGSGSEIGQSSKRDTSQFNFSYSTPYASRQALWSTPHLTELQNQYAGWLNDRNLTLNRVGVFIATNSTIESGDDHLYDVVNQTQHRCLHMSGNGLSHTIIAPTVNLSEAILSYVSQDDVDNRASESMRKRLEDGIPPEGCTECGYEGIDWVSYNTYGENMAEANEYVTALYGQIDNDAYDDQLYSLAW